MALRSLERCVKYVGFTGLLPLTLNKSHSKLRFKISKPRIAINTFIALFSTIQLINQLIYFESYLYDQTLPRFLISIYWSTMNGITCTIAHILAIKNRQKICEFCNALFKLLQKISNLTGKTPQPRLWKFIIFGEIASLILIASDFTQFAWINIFEYLVINLSMIIVIHLGVFHLILASGVKEVSQAFEEHLCSFEKFGVNEVVLRFCSVYHDIFELSQEFCKIFGTVSLFLISHMFIMIIIATYMGLQEIEEILDYFMLIGWSIYGFTAIILLIYPCVNLSEQGMVITGTVYKYLAKSTNPRVTEQLMKFAMLLNHEKIQFSPYNLFPFTYGLILTIAGSSISYMIILTQFDNKTNNCTYMSQD